MRKMLYAFILLGVVAVSGCSHYQERLQDLQVSTGQNVFQEVATGSPIPSGYADLTTIASLKTHTAKTFRSKDAHGTPDYLLLLNIDGQAMHIKGDLREEEMSDHLRNPEAGRGTRYTFRAHIRLRSGPHKIALALPADAVITEYEVALEDKTENTLEVYPIYGKVHQKQRVGFYGVTDFSEGVKGLDAELNRQPLVPPASGRCEE